MNQPTQPVAAWVLGAGGLLGSAVCRALRTSVPGTLPFVPAPKRVPWEDVAACGALLDESVRQLFSGEASRPWMLFWCAGAGRVGAPEEVLERETAVFSALLESISRHRPETSAGAIFFASSAGGLYAGSRGLTCDEDTPCRPMSPYGRAKLAQEQLLERWSLAQRNVSTLVARISNLYGPQQNLEKPQGLISQLCRSVILGRPAHIYVPLDTRRDYLYADDCAAVIAYGTARLRRRAARAGGALHVRKVIASERETSIAALLAILRRVAKRPVRVVVTPTAAARLQPQSVRLRSRVWRDLMPWPSTALPIGIHRIWQHQLRQLRRGLLPHPRPLRANLAPGRT